MSTHKSASVPLRLPAQLQDKIATASGRLNMSKQEVMRLALEIGLEDLKRIDYDLAAAIADAARAEATTAEAPAPESGNAPPASIVQLGQPSPGNGGKETA